MSINQSGHRFGALLIAHIVLAHLLTVQFVLGYTYDNGQAATVYLYDYDSTVHVEHATPVDEDNKSKHAPLVYSTKAKVQLEVAKLLDSNVVELIAKFDSLESDETTLFSTETTRSILDHEFAFELDTSMGRVLAVRFASDDSAGSVLFKKAFVDHFNYDPSKVSFFCLFCFLFCFRNRA